MGVNNSFCSPQDGTRCITYVLTLFLLSLVKTDEHENSKTSPYQPKHKSDEVQVTYSNNINESRFSYRNKKKLVEIRLGNDPTYPNTEGPQASVPFLHHKRRNLVSVIRKIFQRFSPFKLTFFPKETLEPVEDFVNYREHFERSSAESSMWLEILI